MVSRFRASPAFHSISLDSIRFRTRKSLVTSFVVKFFDSARWVRITYFTLFLECVASECAKVWLWYSSHLDLRHWDFNRVQFSRFLKIGFDKQVIAFEGVCLNRRVREHSFSLSQAFRFFGSLRCLLGSRVIVNLTYSSSLTLGCSLDVSLLGHRLLCVIFWIWFEILPYLRRFHVQSSLSRILEIL